MKKLMFAAALAATFGVFADIQSSNTVGYQNFNGVGGFTLTVPTFVPVGTDGSSLTLGNLRATEEFVAGADALALFDGTGTLTMSVTYYPEGDPDGYGIAAGWYEIDDFNNSDTPTLLNSTAIPYGTGFAFSRATSTAAVSYVGEVKESATTLPSTGGFTLCGNVSPTDLTLANFKGNSDFVAGADALSLFDGTGTLTMSVTYYPEGDPDGYGIAGGWYEMDDFNNSDTPTLLNNTPIAAGLGFAFSRATTTARVIVTP